MTEIIIDGFACADKPKDFKEIYGDPFGDFFERTNNPLSPEGFDQTFNQVDVKPRVKGIAEDWFREELRKGLAKRRQQAAQQHQALASEPSKKQHADHKADQKLQKGVKRAQDFKQRKQRSLASIQKRLATLNSKRPKDPTKIKAWSDRRQALVKQIGEKRESLRYSDKRIADMREEYRGN